MTFDEDLDAIVKSRRIVKVGEPSAMVGAYDAAKRFDNTIAMWQPSLSSADADILPEKDEIDAKVLDTLRNDAYAQGGATLHKDSIVGSLFLLNSRPDYRVLGLDETWADEFQQEIEAKFTIAAESPDCWFDAARQNTLTELVRLAVGVTVAGGETLAAVEWIRDNLRPFKTAIQMIDTARLSTPANVIEGPQIRKGVEFNSRGEAIAYHVRVAHPNDYVSLAGNRPIDSWRWKRVEARKPWGRLQIIHLFEQMRPAQSRGISPIASALKEIRITRKFRDVVLQNAVVNASYAAAIESELPSETVFAQLGADGDPGQAITSYTGAYLQAVNQYSGGGKNLGIDGVKIPHLFPGTKFKLMPAGQGGPLGTEFEQSLLRYLAASLNVSYEQLSKDYTETNYSSARAAMVETWKHMQVKKKLIADRFATIVFRLWFEEMFNAGQIESLPRNAPSIYGGLNLDAYTACEWIGAARGQIDELKETQAAIARINARLSTREAEAARLGVDFRKVFRQQERERIEMEQRGILPTDEAQVAADANAPADGDSDDQ